MDGVAASPGPPGSMEAASLYGVVGADPLDCVLLVEGCPIVVLGSAIKLSGQALRTEILLVAQVA